MTWQEALTNLWIYRWEICLIGFILWHRGVIYKEFIFNPLAGGNGKIQMDEVAKGVFIFLIIRCADREGKGAEQVYPDVFWTMLFLSVCAIAAIKPAFSSYYKAKHKEENKTHVSTEQL